MCWQKTQIALAPCRTSLRMRAWSSNHCYDMAATSTSNNARKRNQISRWQRPRFLRGKLSSVGWSGGEKNVGCVQGQEGEEKKKKLGKNEWERGDMEDWDVRTEKISEISKGGIPTT